MAAKRPATKATPSARPRARKARRDWRPAFLDAFELSGTVTGGCSHAQIERSTAYRERERDEGFAARWSDVEDRVTDRLEMTALRLALEGEVRLLEFLLKARRPATYREHHTVEHTGPGGGPVPVALTLDAKARKALGDVLRSRPATRAGD